MPYLHWETDRQRKKFSQFLEKETQRNRKHEEDEERRRKEERQKSRGALVVPKYKMKGDDIIWTSAADNSRADDKVPPIVAWTAASALKAKIPLYSRLGRRLKSPIFKDENGRIIAKRAVGQVLFDAAMLYEAMSNYRDKKFIQRYLHEEPPLHPRRTLDQAYYWTLKTTRTRDRDQVVYRGTMPTPEHSIDPETGEWNCLDVDSLATKEAKQKAQIPQSVGKVKRYESHCIHCRSHIQKVSRLLMVDQLWMWILDEKTIITAFPKRYGMNKQDQSSVHKSIRTRLQNLHQGHIKTVFDLALIILDECSNTFFKTRTRTAVRPPSYCPPPPFALSSCTHTDIERAGSTATGPRHLFASNRKNRT